VMQADGNLCTYRGTSPTTFQHGPTWCSNAVSGGGPVFLVQQDDGNLCVYKGAPTHYGAGLWCHNTGVDATRLELRSGRGSLGHTAQVRNTSSYPLWVTFYDGGSIGASGCVAPEGIALINWKGGGFRIRGELTSKPGCGHPVICDVSHSVSYQNWRHWTNDGRTQLPSASRKFVAGPPCALVPLN
jgi:hypothetical protein